jgi:hypothetical protein
MSLKIVHVCNAFQLRLAIVCTYEQRLPLSLQVSGSVLLSYILALHRLHPQPCNSPISEGPLRDSVVAPLLQPPASSNPPLAPPDQASHLMSGTYQWCQLLKPSALTTGRRQLDSNTCSSYEDAKAL